MTGFAQQMFRLHDLPKEIASWMIDQGKKCDRVEMMLAKLN